jgi:predicted PurR-regulated permease PerM
MNESTNTHDNPTELAIEISIRLGIVVLLLAACLQILAPFISLVVWGGIIAIAIYTPFLMLVEKLGGRTKLAIGLLAVVSIAAIVVPMITLSSSLVESATIIGAQIDSGTAHISPPSESVREWPLVGEKVYGIWQQASVNLSALLQKYPEQVRAVGAKLLGGVAGASIGLMQFMASMLIAAVFLASAEAVNKGVHLLANRLSPGQGEALLIMSVNTIRSVSVGVIGIAFIQALAGGLGMMFVGVPAAGLLAIVILVLAIAQLPPLLVLGPVVFYVFSVESTTMGVAFLIWSLLVSFSDAALKPLLLGRGVDAPMLVILLGAIGGMIMSGIVGLFIGAVVLAVGYKLMLAWIGVAEPGSEASPEPGATS